MYRLALWFNLSIRLIKYVLCYFLNVCQKSCIYSKNCSQRIDIYSRAVLRHVVILILMYRLALWSNLSRILIEYVLCYLLNVRQKPCIYSKNCSRKLDTPKYPSVFVLVWVRNYDVILPSWGFVWPFEFPEQLAIYLYLQIRIFNANPMVLFSL